jgi:hypothetical protein
MRDRVGGGVDGVEFAPEFAPLVDAINLRHATSFRVLVSIAEATERARTASRKPPDDATH